PPESTWTGNVARRWVLVLGVPLYLDQWAQACVKFPADQSERCGLVAALMKLAADTLGSGCALPSLAGLPTGSSIEGASTQGSGRTPGSNRGRLPLRVDPLKREIRVEGSDRVAEFGDNELAFKLIWSAAPTSRCWSSTWRC